MVNRFVVLTAAGLLACVPLVHSAAQNTPLVGSRTLHVSPSGSDEGPGSAERPLRSLQRALDLAEPGTTIALAEGVYDPAETRRPGRSDAPIVIQGIETGRNALRRFRTVIRGPRIVLQINHSHYQVRGLTVDGQPNIPPATFPPSPSLDVARAFKDAHRSAAANSKLIYVGYAADSRDLTGIVLDDLWLHGAGGECVRFRNNAFGNVVSNSVIRWCGMFPGGDDTQRYRYHNGEGVYIGTSPKSTTQPMFANDASHENEVRDSLIVTYGSECFQVKENAHHNRMVRVECRANDEPVEFSGSNVELRGDHNTVEDSVLAMSRGVNLKIASDEAKYDRGGNGVVRTRFLDAAGPHILFKSTQPIGPACGNTFETARIVSAGQAFVRAAEPCR